MIKFLCFDYQNQSVKEKLIESIETVIASNNYVLGDNVFKFETSFSKLNH